jgi:ribose transport system ATP-binding protein
VEEKGVTQQHPQRELGADRTGSVAVADTATGDALERAAGSVGRFAAAVEVGEVVLRLDGADKHYPGVHALKDVSLTVRRGEVHALVGENGAGKSTLVGVAAGTVTADSGEVEIDGERTAHPTPNWARERGLAIVYQEPALLPDLTVAENMRLGMPQALRPSVGKQGEWAAELLKPWQNAAVIDPSAYVRDLRPDERFVVEIAKAMAENPSVLILDEPTEHLLPEGVAELFREIKEVVQRGAAIVYISHRIHEVKQVASTISVLRDGALEGTFPAAGVSEHEIIDLIVGRKLEARFPPKADPKTFGETVLKVEGFTGVGHSDVAMTVRQGEIVGLAGIDGHGQRETLRALAGLTKSSGAVEVSGRRVRLRGPGAAKKAGFSYLPNDRHTEGVLPSLSVRENATVRALEDLAVAGVVQPVKERRVIREQIKAYNIKTPSSETPIDSLSGGNQQKVMLSRTLLTGSPVVLADEPTQGVDVGARAEIYAILRTAASDGACVLVCSSDASELEGLCDRVLIFSRGNIVTELAGDENTERRITESALTATAERHREQRGGKSFARKLHRFAQSDVAPSVVLAIAIVILGVVAMLHSEFYLTERNFGLVLPLLAILAVAALGQQMVMMIGGIDLSIGPLMGLVAVVASFRLTPDQTAAGLLVGWLLVIGIAVAVGFTNWFLATVLRINPLIATLVTFTLLQGVSLLLRETPGGSFATDITDGVESSIGFVPVVLLLGVVLAVLLEFSLYRSLFGVKLRGVGSKAAVAEKLGVRSKRITLYAYVGCSLLGALAAVLLLPQVGSGNATAGTTYTLATIGAVVLGGASVFGGRGSFIGAFLGAALVIQINTVVQFLELSDYWQQYLLGGLTIVAAAFYSKTRASSARS